MTKLNVKLVFPLIVLLGITCILRGQMPNLPNSTSFTLPSDSRTTTSLENGVALYQAMGCCTCHSIANTQDGMRIQSVEDLKCQSFRGCCQKGDKRVGDSVA